jgi:transposase
MIGEETSERLDVLPSQYRVIGDRHASSEACLPGLREDGAGERTQHLIKSGFPTEAMVASVIVAKYGWHLPLYRFIARRRCLRCKASTSTDPRLPSGLGMRRLSWLRFMSG